MLKNPELENQRQKAQEAFEHAQSLWAQLQSQQEQVAEARSEQLRADKLFAHANGLVTERQITSRRERNLNCWIWSNYDRIRERISARIKALKHQRKFEKNEIVRCTKEAKWARQDHEEADAVAFANEAYEHEKRLRSLDRQINALTAELRAAKQQAKKQATRTARRVYSNAYSDRWRAAKRQEKATKNLQKLQQELEITQGKYNIAVRRYYRILKALLSDPRPSGAKSSF